MAILLEAVGALIVVALVIRGAMAFWADYRNRNRQG
jgi:hypothetical protein